MTATMDFFERKRQELGVSLSEIQRKAVLRAEGPLLLLASPGSGKTTTIIMRIGYLIEEKGANPARIKAVTFSRASANDMKERFKRFFPQLPPVGFSTIHSLAFEVMRDFFFRTRTEFRIIEGDLDPEEQEAAEAEATIHAGAGAIAGAGERSGFADGLPLHKKIILRTLFRQIAGDNITDDQMEELTTYISYIKNKMVPPAEWADVPVSVPDAERVLREYETYKQRGHAKRLVDYDDMLTIAERALEENPALLRKYQDRYDYVLTDESQDTSPVQHAIVEKLVRRHRNLCVVADDDQSIYSWRGADPAYLLSFKQVYPNAVTMLLERNYRSSPEIVGAANEFIKRNRNRYVKNMFTRNPPAKPIRIRSLADYAYQAKLLAREVQRHENLSEVAILYRNNSSSITLMNEFDRAGIPFYMKDADNRFFSHWVVEDVLNFMRMTFTDKRADLFERIHLKMSGYVSKQQMAALKEIRNNESVFDNLLRHVPLKEYQPALIQASRETFEQMRGMPPLPAIRVIRERLGYEKAIEKMCERLGFRKEYLIGILNTLEEIAAGLETMEDFANRLNHLKTVLKNAKRRKGENAVTFSTFHSAKGLEFERVYMIDLADGIIPSSDDAKKEELLEEATRLFYVGMTRAKKHLELIAYRKRDGADAEESAFVTAVRHIVDPESAAAERAGAASRSNSASPGSSGTGRAGTPSDNGRSGKPRRSGPGRATVVAERPPAPALPNAIRSPAELSAGQPVKHGAFGTGSIARIDGDQIEIRFGAAAKTLSLKACLERGLLAPV